MRKLLLLLALLLSCLGAGAQGDSLATAALDARMEVYFSALEHCSIEEKKAEVDFMIGSCPDDSLRSHVARKIYAHYLNSPLMGDEAVAIYLTDNWFVPGKASFANDIDLMNARIYADFNRSSLLGEKAQALNVYGPSGEPVAALAGEDGSVVRWPRLRVLFFYDISCVKCRMETIMLRSVFRSRRADIDFVAFYTGSDEEGWQNFRKENLDFNLPRGRMHHCWDPDLASGYEYAYGVLQTPCMFLIARDGTILGRKLDTAALVALLDNYDRDKALEYGDERSRRLYSSLLPEGEWGEDQLRELCRSLGGSTLEKGDTLGFRQVAGDLLYHLSSGKGPEYALGAGYVADSLVLDRPDIWRTHDDSLKVVGLAEMIHDLRQKALPGSRLPSLKIHSVLMDRKGSSEGEWRLDRLRRGDVIIFHTKGCQDCRNELEAASALVATSRRRVLLVDVDSLVEEGGGLADAFFGAFDLSSLPYVLEVGRRGTVASRYISLVEK